jgi:hypothetical protein
MPISERAAAQAFRRVGLSREQARLLLRTGVAGPGEPGRTTTYDERRVQDLAERPCVDEGRLGQLCPWGVHVARLARTRSLDVSNPWVEQASELATQPQLPPMTAVTLGVRMRVSGGLPCVVTVSGMVLFGAELTGWTTPDPATHRFVLRPPGPWYDELDRRWFACGRGRHWFFWDPWRLQQ